jgi:hypothetical protein
VRFGAPVKPEDLFGLIDGHKKGVAAHVVGFLVARLLPDGQRGLYGGDSARYLSHPHYRLRIREHTLADVEAARGLAASF